MGQLTSDDYLKELKAWYEQHRKTLHDGLLVEPSNGELRDLCIRLLRNGLSKFDDSAFRGFFKVGTNDNLDFAISKFDIERFRPIVNFLNGNSQTKDKARLNLIAVLIDFPQRPLSTFLKSPDVRSESIRISASGNQSKSPEDAIDRSKGKKRSFFWLIGVGLIGIIVAIVINGNKPAAKCMVWQDDHYVSINCQDSTFNQIEKEPLDSKQFELNKIPVSENTVFFVKGKSKVWYLRHDNQYEFFDQPGYHPINRKKTLKPVTSYIAMKVVDGEIKGE